MDSPRKRTILVVDDSAPTRLYLKRLLEKQHYTVVVAVDGSDGARLAMEILPDLILLDKEMPGMGGYDVCSVLRRRPDTNAIPILMISTADSAADRIRGLQVGADDFITKSISAEELYSKIRAFLRITDLQVELRKERDTLNQIFRYLHEPVAICGHDDKIQLASRVFLQLLRMPRDVMRFKSMTEILTTLGVSRETIDSLRGGVVEEERLTITVDDQVTYLTARTAKIQLDNDKMAMAYVFRDITRVVEAERMKSDFHSMIAHDLRSPMSVIQGYVSLMSAGKTGDMNETQVEFLESVSRKIVEMTALLNDFLDINKIDAGFVNLKRDDMNLCELIREVVSDLHPMAEGFNITIDVDFPEENVAVFADPMRLTQILRNLVSNAIKYNRENGWIRVSVVRDDAWVRMQVADGGIGMTAEEMEVLFDPYVRGSSQRSIKGVGLGVVIVKKLVEAHDGQINVASVPDKGSTFTVSLPLGVGPAVPTEDQALAPSLA